LYKLKEIHGVQKIYFDFEDFLSDKNLDAVIITTPNHLHTPLAIAAMEFKKHILLEKPVSLNLFEAEFLLEKKKEFKNLVLMPVANQALRPDVQKIKEMIEKNLIGKIYHIECGYRKKRFEFEEVEWKEKEESGGGVLFVHGIQILEILYYIFRKIPEKIISSLYKEEVEKEVFSFFKIDNISVNFEIKWDPQLIRDYMYFNIYGEKGIISLNPFKVVEKRYGKFLDIKPEIDEEESFFKISFSRQIKNFINSIKGKEKPFFEIEDAINIIRIIEKIKESAE
ncbi:MAG: Gfo/Idh/MocA family oxidoreductase, partial [candidate division WOR-3 bacterium]